ncbi:MAG: alpha/beta hydrolase [Treponema sp.]|jgi:acetyl esterase/lipase|nr:alpha/beta hydrolase [Treponema sp.]
MRKIAAGLFVLFCLFFIAACASAGKTPELHYTPHRDLRYGSYERNVVDISIPGAASEGVILFIHGGIWMYGDKSSCPVFLDAFRDRFVVASMSHRYIDETTHINDLVDDVSAAVGYIREFCSQHNRDSGKLIIMGHSSGAHLSMLYAYKHYETSPVPIAFCVNMAGPSDLGDIAFRYNFEKLGWVKFFYDLSEKAAGYHITDGDVTSEGYSETALQILAAISPITFVTGNSPPTIIVHDVTDALVPYANSAALHSVFNVYGVDHRFIALHSGVGHFLGARAVKGGALRYDKTVESRVAGAMSGYMEKYCR